jgi:hypothetical protein
LVSARRRRPTNQTMAGATDRPARRRLRGGAAIDQAGRCQI